MHRSKGKRCCVNRARSVPRPCREARQDRVCDAKQSDSLTLEERKAFKERIKEEFAFHNLKMYPYDNEELDDEERSVNTQIKVRITRLT